MAVPDKELGRGEGDIGVATVAMALGISVRQVQRLARAGMPRRAPGVYDLGEVVAWYIAREVERKVQRRMAGGVDGERLMERLRREVHLGAPRASDDMRRPGR